MLWKRTTVVSHWGSFDQPTLQLLDDCRFALVLPTKILKKKWGLVIYRWKGLKIIFPTVYYTRPKMFNIAVLKRKRKICSHFGKVFLLVMLGEVLDDFLDN